MNLKSLTLILIAASSAFAESHWSFRVNVGGYGPAYYAPPPAPVVVRVPPCPGPDYSWVDGYWYPNGPRYTWTAGYWARRPYSRAYWVAPRYYQHRYYRGYWGRGYERGFDRRYGFRNRY